MKNEHQTKVSVECDHELKREFVRSHNMKITIRRRPPSDEVMKTTQRSQMKNEHQTTVSVECDHEYKKNFKTTVSAELNIRRFSFFDENNNLNL